MHCTASARISRSSSFRIGQMHRSNDVKFHKTHQKSFIDGPLIFRWAKFQAIKNNVITLGVLESASDWIRFFCLTNNLDAIIWFAYRMLVIAFHVFRLILIAFRFVLFCFALCETRKYPIFGTASLDHERPILWISQQQSSTAVSCVCPQYGTAAQKQTTAKRKKGFSNEMIASCLIFLYNSNLITGIISSKILTLHGWLFFLAFISFAGSIAFALLTSFSPITVLISILKWLRYRSHFDQRLT